MLGGRRRKLISVWYRMLEPVAVFLDGAQSVSQPLDQVSFPDAGHAPDQGSSTRLLTQFVFTYIPVPFTHFVVKLSFAAPESAPTLLGCGLSKRKSRRGAAGRDSRGLFRNNF